MPSLRTTLSPFSKNVPPLLLLLPVAGVVGVTTGVMVVMVVVTGACEYTYV
jgi:hypothetical protein